jgi:signal recognition particle subunit SRP54
LGQGDIVSLVEKAAQDIDQEKAAKMAKRLQKGAFDLNDLKEQMQQMQKLGGMGGLMGMMPGIGKMKKQIDQAGIDDKAITRQIAIIQSMTPKERAKPDVLKASRKKRIAAGSGMQVADVNKLLKMHRQMADMMKAMGKKKGGMLGGLFGGGMPSPDEIAAAQAAQGGGDAGGAPNLDPDALAKMAQQAGGGLPGFGRSWWLAGARRRPAGHAWASRLGRSPARRQKEEAQMSDESPIFAPTLETERLILRGWDVDDFSDLGDVFGRR